MTKDEYIEKVWSKITQDNNSGCLVPTIYACTIFSFVVLLLSSCVTRTNVEYRDRDVNHYITQYVHDTLHVESSDSIHHEIRVVNDTVYDTKYVERTRWKERIVEIHDTCKSDSVVTEYKETTREIIKIPKVYRYAMGFTVFIFIFALVKLIKWLRTNGCFRT